MIVGDELQPISRVASQIELAVKFVVDTGLRSSVAANLRTPIISQHRADMQERTHTLGVNVNSTRSEVNNSPDWNGAGKVNKPSEFAAQTPSSNMDEPSNDPQIGTSELYDQLMDFCEQGGLEINDVLTALLLALRDLAIDHYGIEEAHQASVSALDEAFDLAKAGYPYPTLQ